MAKSATPFSAIAAALFLLLHTGLAHAQSARTWVSGIGDDNNPCTRAAPCATFSGAYGKTSPGGEIDVLDGGDFGAVWTNHAITFANDGVGVATATSIGYGFPAIEIVAGSTDAVVLRGVTLNGATSSGVGIELDTGASLLIDHCKIQGFLSNPGIEFTPNSFPSKLWVTDTVLSNDGGSGLGSIFVGASRGAAATAHLERVQVLNANGNGIRVEGSGANGATDVELHDVTVDGASASGIVATSWTSGPAVNIMADEVTSSHNIGYGVRAVGGGKTIFLSRSTITANTVGIGASSGGVIASFSNNRITGNANGDGSPTTVLPRE
jgi:hypothetical protein